MKRILLVAVLLAAVVGTPKPSFAEDTGPVILSPAQIGQIFCMSRIGNDMAPVEGLLTPDLTAVIAHAWEVNSAYEDEYPGEKPPLGDGLPWQAWPDYASKCDVGEIAIDGDRATVALSYGFPEYPRADFTDTLQLVLIDDAELGWKVWRIDNIAYENGDFRSALEAAFDFV